MTARQTELDTLAPSPTALFRFSVVSQVLSRLLGGQQRAQAVGDVVAAEHATPEAPQAPPARPARPTSPPPERIGKQATRMEPP